MACRARLTRQARVCANFSFLIPNRRPAPRVFTVISRTPVSSCAVRSFTCTAIRHREGREKESVGEIQGLPQIDTRSRQDSFGRDFAFAFDIDGVLTRGKTAIDGALAAIRALKLRGIRYVLLTNGGGYREEDKVKSLNQILGASPEEQLFDHRVILSHTPMRSWEESTKRGTVLITGSTPENARAVAEEYGFEKVVTPADLLAANSKIYPFEQLRDSLHSTSRDLPNGLQVPDKDVFYAAPGHPQGEEGAVDTSGVLKIDQILIWNDPRDWSVDIQVIHDLLVSKDGYLGTISQKNGQGTHRSRGWQQDGQPSVWVSNLDLYWKTDYHLNRLGTGAFVEALKGVWEATTGGVPLMYNALGKPSQFTYQYAQNRLLHLNWDIERVMKPQKSGQKLSRADERRSQPLKRVYMVGDNPASDIKGANDFKTAGTDWYSNLVMTGVFSGSTDVLSGSYQPTHLSSDVLEAVQNALNQEGEMVTRKNLILGERAAVGTANGPWVVDADTARVR